MKISIRHIFFLLFVFCLGLPGILIAQVTHSARIQIDGSKQLSQLDGIGVNANTRSWSPELVPALNLLLDSMHASVWRVVVETVEKWEDVNDNNDPFTFNWEYYNALYETPKFQKVWEMVAFLNKRGITDKLMINFMGPVPAWMGKKTIKPEYEDEYIEMVASFFLYAKKRGLTIGLLSPTNESDWRNEGPEIDEKAYARLMKKLMDRMESLGMGDLRYVGPDPASMKNGINRYIPELMKDAQVMSKLKHIGLHSYGGYYADVDSMIQKSSYPKSDVWITEWNAWRDSLDEGKIGVYDYNFAGQCVYQLLDLLKHGITAAMVWEGYDSYYEHHAPSLFSYWGILGYDPKTKTYAPRKHFYAIQQVSRFIAPGSHQLAVSETKDSLTVVAYQDNNTKAVTIVGVNRGKQPIQLQGQLLHLSPSVRYKMIRTSATEDLFRSNDVVVANASFTVSIPANSIFTLVPADEKKKEKAWVKPEPANWFAGDIHVHRNCGTSTQTVSSKELHSMMDVNNLSVISVLADMGNGEVADSRSDLPRVTGKDELMSSKDRIVHWDAEWHWDATYSNFSNQALGGHVVLLGLKEAHQIWDESPYKLLEWGRKQNAIVGFCHFEYLNDAIQNELNCCIPIEYPVEAALGTMDYVSEDVFGTRSPNNGTYNSEAAMNAYYRLLNCGFRLGLAAGTDFPCNNNEALGTLLTFVNIPDGKLTYAKWIDGIKKGKTVVSRNAHQEFIDLRINGRYSPGDVIEAKNNVNVSMEVKWTAASELTGTIELVRDGKVIASKATSVKPGASAILTATEKFRKSGWICARRMDSQGHQTHTAPVYIRVDNAPVRSSADDAQFFISWIDNLIAKTSPGGNWNRYFTHDLDVVQARYRQAREVYSNILAEAHQLEGKK